MDLLVRMGYEEVYLLGFDGYVTPHHYFYEDPTYYPEVSKAWKEAISAGLRVKGKPPVGWSLDTGGNIFEVKTTGKTKHGGNGYEQVLTLTLTLTLTLIETRWQWLRAGPNPNPNPNPN